jgi:hypothetical protein
MLAELRSGQPGRMTTNRQEAPDVRAGTHDEKASHLMSAFAMKRRLGRKGSLGLAAAIVTTGVVSASLAFAQAAPPPPDGGPPQGAVAPIRTDCGPDVKHTIITRSSPSTKNAPGFAMLPGAGANILVPDGGGCLKVLFTAETACSPTANPDFCYVRALVDAAPMDPNGTGFQAMDSEDASASAHAYEWVKRLPAGNHNVEIQWNVLNAGTQFWVDDWTFDIGVYQ